MSNDDHNGTSTFILIKQEDMAVNIYFYDLPPYFNHFPSYKQKTKALTLTLTVQFSATYPRE